MTAATYAPHNAAQRASATVRERSERVLTEAQTNVRIEPWATELAASSLALADALETALAALNGVVNHEPYGDGHLLGDDWARCRDTLVAIDDALAGDA